MDVPIQFIVYLLEKLWNLLFDFNSHWIIAQAGKSAYAKLSQRLLIFILLTLIFRIKWLRC